MTAIVAAAAVGLLEPTLPRSRPGGLAASEPGATTLTAVGQLGGPTRGVAYGGRVTYVGRGPRVLSFATCAPEWPIAMGGSDVLAGPVLDVVADRGLVYAALGEAGLAVLDARDPARLALVGRLPLYGVAARLVPSWADERLYVVAGYGGFHILSLADPLAPRPLGHFQAVVSDAAVHGDFAYLVKRDFTVLDMTDPSAPRQLRKLEDWADAVASWGGMLAVAISSPVGEAQREGAVRLYDLADPRRPKARGTLPVGPPVRLMRVVDDRLVAYQPESGRIIDVSDPDRPVDALTFGAFGTVTDVDGTGGALLQASGTRGLRTLVVDGATAREVYADEPLGDARAVTVADGVAFVEDEGGGTALRVFDLRRPRSPWQIAAVEQPVSRQALLAGGGVLYVGDPAGSIRSYDVGDPTRPRLLDDLPLGSTIWGLDGLGAGLVVANDTELVVVHAADPSALARAGSVRTSGGATDVAADRETTARVYVAGPSTGLEQGRPSLMAVDVSDRERPRELYAMPDAAGWRNGLAAAGGTVYVDGLQVVRDDGARLAQAAGLDVEGQTRSLELVGDTLYGALRLDGGGGRIAAYDVARVDAPVVAGSSELVDEAFDVAHWRGYLLVAAGESGLVVLETGGAEPPPTATRQPDLTVSIYLPVAATGPIGAPCPPEGAATGRSSPASGAPSP